MRRRGLGILLLAAWLGGCALPLSAPQVEQRLDGWLEAGQYHKALTALRGLPADDPAGAALRERLPEVEKQARAAERKLLSEAETLTKQGRWLQAQQVFDDARERLGETAALSNAYEGFLQRRGARLQALDREQLLQQARWLLEDRRLRRAMAEVAAPDADTRRQWAAREAAERAVAQRLVTLGQEALAHDDVGGAEQALVLAEQLHPTSAGVQALADLEQRQYARQLRRQWAAQQRAEREDAAARQRKIAQQQQTDALLAQLDAALQRSDLLQAHEVLQRLLARAPEAPEVLQRRRLVAARVRAEVSAGLEKGSRFYSAGEVGQALAVWEGLLPLDPDNVELKTLVERARRVLHKVQELSDRAAPPLSPAR